MVIDWWPRLAPIIFGYKPVEYTCHTLSNGVCDVDGAASNFTR